MYESPQGNMATGGLPSPLRRGAERLNWALASSHNVCGNCHARCCAGPRCWGLLLYPQWVDHVPAAANPVRRAPRSYHARAAPLTACRRPGSGLALSAELPVRRCRRLRVSFVRPCPFFSSSMRLCADPGDPLPRPMRLVAKPLHCLSRNQNTCSHNT